MSVRNPSLYALVAALAFSARFWVHGEPPRARALGLAVLALVALSLAGIGRGLAPRLTIRRLVIGTIVGVVALGIATFVAGERTEVVVLRTRDDAGAMHETKVWCVDHEGATWVRVANPERWWYRRLLARPDVELVRHGETTARFAHPDSSPATRLALDQAFAAKYGLVDFWYGALLRRGPVPIRLDPPS